MKELIEPEDASEATPPPVTPPGPGRAWFVAAGALGLVLAPLIVADVADGKAALHESLCPVLAGLCLFSAAARLRRQGPGRLPSVSAYFLLCAVALAAAAAAVLFRSGATLVLMAIAGPALAWSLGGWRLAVAILPAWIWLTVLLPQTGRLYESWRESDARPWDVRTTGWASILLDRSGLLHRVEERTEDVDADFVVRTRHGETHVPQPFDGALSPVLVLALTGLYAAAAGRGWLRSIILLGAAAFWSVAAEAGRLAALTLLAVRQDVPPDGPANDLIAGIAFASALALVLSLDCGLSFLFPFGGKVAIGRARAWLAEREAAALAPAVPDHTIDPDPVADSSSQEDIASRETEAESPIRTPAESAHPPYAPGPVDAADATPVALTSPTDDSSMRAAVDPLVTRRIQRRRAAAFAAAAVALSVVWLLPPQSLPGSLALGVTPKEDGPSDAPGEVPEREREGAEDRQPAGRRR